MQEYKKQEYKKIGLPDYFRLTSSKFILLRRLLLVFVLITALFFVNQLNSRSSTNSRSGVSKAPALRGRVLGIDTNTNTAMCGIDIGNANICPKPALPALPSANGIITDPTFGTKIIRITDAITAPKGATLNSEASNSMFNSDGSLFYLMFGNQEASRLFSIDSLSKEVAYLGNLPNEVNYNSVHWDALNSNIFYGIGRAGSIWQFNIRSLRPLDIQGSPLFNFTDTMVPPQNSRLLIDNSNRYFALLYKVGSATGGFYSVMVWDRNTRLVRTLYTPSRLDGMNIDFFEMDNSGQYIILKGLNQQEVINRDEDESFLGIDSVVNIKWYVWDWINDTVENLSTDDPDNFDNPVIGSGEAINKYTTSLISRSLSSPHKFSELTNIPEKNDKVNYYEPLHTARIYGGANPFFVQGFYVDSNFALSEFEPQESNPYLYKISPYLKQASGNNLDVPEVARVLSRDLQNIGRMPNAPDQWYYDSQTDSLYIWFSTDYGKISGLPLSIFDWRPMTEEIVEFLQVNGGWTWRRLAHHRAQFSGDLSTAPRANPDPTGSYVLFSSNWDSTLKNIDGSARSDIFLLIAPPLPLPPIISDVSISNFSSGTIDISWNTNKPATSQVEFGKTADYGRTTDMDGALVTSHTAHLSGLESGNVYHFDIKSKDDAGSLAVSDDYTFNAVEPGPSSTAE